MTPIAATALGHKNWALRVLGLEALGNLASAQTANKASAVSTLSKVATSDTFALVRETALHQLFRVDVEAGRKVAKELAKSDPEPRVRARAATLAGGTTP